MSDLARPAKLMIVDDSGDQLRQFAADFRTRGYEVVPVLNTGPGYPASKEEHAMFHCFEHSDELCTLVQAQRPDAVLSDFQMVSMNGNGVVRAVKHMQPSIPVLVHTSTFDRDMDDRERQDEIRHWVQQAGGAGVIGKNLAYPGFAVMRVQAVEALLHARGMRFASKPSWAERSQSGDSGMQLG